MWQFVVAAAVAGCGYYAKRFLSNVVDPGEVYVSEEESNEIAQEENGVVVGRKEEEKESADLVKNEDLISSIDVSSRVSGGSSEFCGSFEKQNLVVEKEGIFRFSSLNRNNGSGSNAKGLVKKVGLRRNVDSVSKRRIRVEKIGKKLSFGEDDEVVMEEKRKKGKKFSVCLKRRRTSKNGKCGSWSSGGDPVFGWGLGLGIMYMVSAGKAEIDKMNEAIEETTKVVNNLKSELHKRKISCNLVKNLNCEKITDGGPKDAGKNKLPPLTNSSTVDASPNDTKGFGLSSADDVDCASSILTEEPELEALERDRLEAELESELLKIPDEVDPEYHVEVACTEFSANLPPGPCEADGMDSKPFQFDGVSPYELDNKLCHLLIDQQESQILELESNLYSSQAKLHEKEAELQRLKDVVRRLTDFSLETASDGETEDPEAPNDKYEMNNTADCVVSLRLVADDHSNKRLGLTEQKSVCGMKRAMEFESCNDCRVGEFVMQ